MTESEHIVLSESANPEIQRLDADHMGCGDVGGAVVGQRGGRRGGVPGQEQLQGPLGGSGGGASVVLTMRWTSLPEIRV